MIDENGNQLGIMTPSDALKLARESNLDLIKVAPMAKPPLPKSSASYSKSKDLKFSLISLVAISCVA